MKLICINKCFTYRFSRSPTPPPFHARFLYFCLFAEKSCEVEQLKDTCGFFDEFCCWFLLRSSWHERWIGLWFQVYWIVLFVPWHRTLICNWMSCVNRAMTCKVNRTLRFSELCELCHDTKGQQDFDSRFTELCNRAMTPKADKTLIWDLLNCLNCAMTRKADKALIWDLLNCVNCAVIRPSRMTGRRSPRIKNPTAKHKPSTGFLRQ